jgi:hypothetical protein
MAVRKTPLKSDTGVCLTRVEEVEGQRVRATHYRLTTLRPAQPRVIADLDLAEAAFTREVAASRLDPVAVMMAGRG